MVASIDATAEPRIAAARVSLWLRVTLTTVQGEAVTFGRRPS
jgi:hypothetical protein